MKTAMWVCSRCGVVRFYHHGWMPTEQDEDSGEWKEVETFPCLTVYASEPVHGSPSSVCEGTVEYYAYADFDRYK